MRKPVLRVCCSTVQEKQVCAPFFFVNCLLDSYHKVPKFWDTRNLCYDLPKVQTKRPNPKGINYYFVKMVQNGPLGAV